MPCTASSWWAPRSAVPPPPPRSWCPPVALRTSPGAKYAALIEGLTGIWNASVRAAVVARLRASGLPADDLLLKLGALSPTLGFAAEKPEWAREWLADPFTQDALLVQQCVVRMLLALRTMADARGAQLTTTIG